MAGANDIDTMLLSDIRDAFISERADRLSSEALTNYLITLEGRPWAEWKNGKPLTKFQLSRCLKIYRVVSGALDLGCDEGRLKGYRLADFEDVFTRYLPFPPISTRELVTGLKESVSAFPGKNAPADELGDVPVGPSGLGSDVRTVWTGRMVL